MQISSCVLNVHSGHRRYDCPIEGCKNVMLVQITTHLLTVHGIPDDKERKKLSLLARKVNNK